MSADDGGLQGLKALTDLLENHLKRMIEQETYVEFAIVSSGENAHLLKEAKDKALKDEKDLLKSLQVLELSDFLKNCVLVERMYDGLYEPLKTEQKAARAKYAKSLAEYEKKAKPKTEGGSIVSLMFSAQNLYKSAFEGFIKEVCAAFTREHVKLKKMPSVMCKNIERTFYKTYYVYKGDHSQLTDLLRCSFVFDSFVDLYKAFGVFEKVANSKSDIKGGVLRAKDRFDPEKIPFGYRDLLVNVMCPGTSVVCEVQFHHKIFYDYKKDSHYVYKRARLFDVGERNLAYEYVTDHIKPKIPVDQKYVSRFDKDEEDDTHGKNEVTVTSLMKEWFPDKNSKDGVSGITEDGETVSYLQILIDQGFDTVDSLKDLTDDELKEMKFKPGHRKQFAKNRDNYFKSLEAKEKEEKEREKVREKEMENLEKAEKKEETEDDSALPKTKNSNNYLAKEKIFIICGKLGGSSGGGGVFLVDIASSQRYTCIREDGYHNAQAMCRITDEKLYACCGTCFGAQGGGGLWEIDVATGREAEVCKGFESCTTMTNIENAIYAVRGQAGGGRGNGVLYCVDPRTGKYEGIGSDWQNATCMARADGKLYIVCGKAYGCNGGGGLYMVDPKMPNQPTMIGKQEWENATHMTNIGKCLYIVCGPPGGGGGVWEVNPENAKYSEVASGWRYTSCMVGLEDTKRIYLCNGVARGQKERTTSTADPSGLYCFDPNNPREGHRTLQQSGWINATLMA